MNAAAWACSTQLWKGLPHCCETCGTCAGAGVFRRVDRGVGEPIWHLSAFDSIVQLGEGPAAAVSAALPLE